MRPFDDIPLEESDYSDVALLLAGAREWPSDEFARDLDARVARRFAPEGPARRPARVRLPRWAAGPAVAVVAGAVAAVVVLSGGGTNRGVFEPAGSQPAKAAPFVGAQQEKPVVHGTHSMTLDARPIRSAAGAGVHTPTISAGAPESAPGSSGAAGSANPATVYGPTTAAQGVNATSAAPVAPGGKQIQSAQLSLTTANEHVDQVAQEVFTVVGSEHGIVQSSHITAATRGSGGGYASFSLSIPTGNLQDAMTQLSRLRFASVYSRTDASQNVSDQYNRDRRQLDDAKALRASLLKQLQTAYTQSAIDSIKAQLKLAEQQIAMWQATLNSLQHQISYSNVSVQINAGGLPVLPAARHSSGFTLGRAGHDALRVLVVSAGVALIALAVMVPLGLVAALLMWLWVWLRQRRREHALDTTG